LNNNRNNNRRRGRGNNNNRGGGNPNQANRIDSRARGNAPQMLDKYKKLAHEASLNDDRVQTEYYLQFADHYFRVIADIKAQKEEAQAKRQVERQNDQEQDQFGDEDHNEDGREERKPRPRRNQRPRGNEDDPEQGSEGDEGRQDEGRPSDDDNPFTRDEAKPKRKPRAPRKKAAEVEPVDSDGGFDPDRLPPAIARANDADSDNAEAPKPRKGLKPRRKPKDDGETLEAVG
jgi:hypothetical protein